MNAAERAKVKADIEKAAEEGNTAKLQEIRSKLMETTGVSEEVIRETELMLMSYVEVISNDADPPQLIHCSEAALRMFFSVVGETDGIKAGASLGPVEATRYGLLLGMAVGIELTERRHA